MLRKIPFVTLICSAAAFASAMDVADLSVSTFADTESSTNVVFSTGRAEVRTFNLSLELDADECNNLAVGFGRDANENGVLDRTETDAVIGWDAGEWFWRDRRAAIEDRSPRSDGRRKLDVQLSLNRRKAAKSIRATDGDSTVFNGNVPSTLFDPEWNLMRVTARGLSDPNGVIVTETLVNAFKVVVR